MKMPSNNVFLKLAYVFLILLSNMASADEPTIEELQKQLDCLVAVEDAYDRLDTIAETWFTDNDSSLNIEKNFQELKSLHNEYFNKVEAIKSKPFPDFKNDTSVGLELENIDCSYPEEMDKYNNLFFVDDRFLLGLSDIEGGLQEVGNEIEYGKNNCQDQFGEQLNETQKIIKAYQQQISTMKKYIAQAAGKRKDLLSIIIQDRRFAIIDSYNQETGKQLNKFATVLDETEIASILLKGLNKWWIENNTPLIAHGMVTQYLQFNAALRELNAYIGVLDEFENKFKSLNSLPDSAKQTALMEVSAYKLVTRKNIEYLNSLGLNGIIEQQKLLAEARFKKGSEYSNECRDLIHRYLQLYNDSYNQDMIDAYDELYWKQIKVCEEKQSL